MKSIGTLLFLFGLASIGFHFFDREVRLLSWINNWGENAAWGIRIALVVVGGLLTFVGGRKSEG